VDGDRDQVRSGGGMRNKGQAMISNRWCAGGARRWRFALASGLLKFERKLAVWRGT